MRNSAEALNRFLKNVYADLITLYMYIYNIHIYIIYYIYIYIYIYLYIYIYIILKKEVSDFIRKKCFVVKAKIIKSSDPFVNQSEEKIDKSSKNTPNSKNTEITTFLKSGVVFSLISVIL